MPPIPTPGNWAKSSPSRGSRPTPPASTTWSTKLEAGAYRAKFETQDRFGKKVVALLPLNVLAPEAKTVPHQGPEPGGRAEVDAGAGRGVHGPLGKRLRSGPGVHRDRTSRQALQSFWTEAGATQQPVKQAVTEAMRGGFTLRVTMVRENRGVSGIPPRRRALDEQEPDGEMGAFRLQAGAGAEGDLDRRDHAGPDAKKAVAEMVAALYDQSLDAYLPHNWQAGFGVFRQDWSRMNQQFENMAKYLNQLQGGWPFDQRNVQITYRSLPSSITVDLWGYGYFGGQEWASGRMMLRRRQPMPGPHGRRCRHAARCGDGRGRQGRRRCAADRPPNAGGGEAGERKTRASRTSRPAGRRQSRRRPARPGARSEPGRGTQEPQRNGLLLPPSALRRRRPGEARIHHARGPDQVEVPGLRPRRPTPRRPA